MTQQWGNTASTAAAAAAADTAATAADLRTNTETSDNTQLVKPNFMVTKNELNQTSQQSGTTMTS